MFVGEIANSQWQSYSNNPCGEIAWSPTQSPPKRTLITCDDDKCTIPTCIECGCPDLIDDDRELWECMSCGYKHFSAVLSRPEACRNWRPPERHGILDWFLESV